VTRGVVQPSLRVVSWSRNDPRRSLRGAELDSAVAGGVIMVVPASALPPLARGLSQPLASAPTLRAAGRLEVDWEPPCSFHPRLTGGPRASGRP